jgi:hypothetical protein
MQAPRTFLFVRYPASGKQHQETRSVGRGIRSTAREQFRLLFGCSLEGHSINCIQECAILLEKIWARHRTVPVQGAGRARNRWQGTIPQAPLRCPQEPCGHSLDPAYHLHHLAMPVSKQATRPERLAR